MTKDETKKKIPRKSLERLFLYLRGLWKLEKQGKDNVSSAELAVESKNTPEQIRKDLSFFGEFGVKGHGYKIDELKEKIGDCLKLKSKHATVLIGYELLNMGFFMQDLEKTGIIIKYTLDKRKDLAGKIINGRKISDYAKIKELLKDSGIKTAIVATDPAHAQESAEDLISLGITSMLNLSPCILDTPGNVTVKNIDIASNLRMLAQETL